jgi:hypothetical protein
MERHDERTWFDPRTGDQVSLTYIGMVPDIPAPLDDLALLRRKLAEETAETGSIIEAHVVRLGGVPALFQLIKLPIPGQDTGLAFIAAFTVPRAGCSAVLRIQCAEGQTTGLRESAVAAQVGFDQCFPPHPYAPELRGQLPYNVADEAGWDQHFPDHPLTRARAWSHRMLATAQVDPQFAALPPFEPAGTQPATGPDLGVHHPTGPEATGQHATVQPADAQPTDGSPAFGQPAEAPAFGQPAEPPTFGQPANPAPAFGQPSEAPAFGQPAEAPTFGQPANPAPAFGQPAEPPTFGQHADAPAFGQPANPAPAFGQPAEAPAYGQPAEPPTFGQPADAPAYGQHADAPHAFGQPSETPTFGQPANPAPAFGQPAEPPAFGQPAETPTFGQPAEASAFGQPAAPEPFARRAAPITEPAPVAQPAAVSPTVAESLFTEQPVENSLFTDSSTIGASFTEPPVAEAPTPVATPGPPAEPGDVLHTVLVGLPLAGYLPLWREDGVTFWRMSDPDAVRARLGAGVESRSEIDSRRFREAAMFSPSRGTLFLMDRYRDETGHLGGTSTQLTEATKDEAYAAVDDRALSELYTWLGEVVLSAVRRSEFVAVESGGWAVPMTPVMLAMLRTDGREWHSVVEASPVPEGAPVWRDQQPVDGNTQVLASPATDQTVRATGLLTRFAVAAWGAHPFQLGLSFGPNPTL